VELFQTDEFYNIMALATGNILFSNFWDCPPALNYNMTVLPGRIEGISGSCIDGYDLGISAHISDERKEAAVKVLKFFTSEHIQKNVVVKLFTLYSGISSLYDDEEACKMIDCNFIKEVQTVIRPINEVEDYGMYSSKFLSLLYEGIYEEKDPKMVLNKINDIRKIYYFSITTEKISLTIFVLLILTMCLITSSVLVLFIPKFKSYFTFLSTDMWILYTIGTLISISSQIIYFSELSNLKCTLIMIMITTGFSMIFLPILCRLIINFPQENKYSSWIKRKKSLFILMVLTTEAILSLLYLISPVKVEKITGNKNYCKCEVEKNLSLVITLFLISIQFLIFISISFLIFLEWNIEETFKDVRALTTVMNMDVVLFALFFIIHFISFNNYLVFYSIHILIILIFTFTNHFYMFILRIIMQSSLWEKPESEKMANKFFNANNHDFKDVLASSIDKSTINDKNSIPMNKTYKSKIMNYHFAKSSQSISNSEYSVNKKFSLNTTNNDYINQKKFSVDTANNDDTSKKKFSVDSKSNDTLKKKFSMDSTSNDNTLKKKFSIDSTYNDNILKKKFSLDTINSDYNNNKKFSMETTSSDQQIRSSDYK